MRRSKRLEDRIKIAQSEDARPQCMSLALGRFSWSGRATEILGEQTSRASKRKVKAQAPIVQPNSTPIDTVTVCKRRGCQSSQQDTQDGVVSGAKHSRKRRKERGSRGANGQDVRPGETALVSEHTQLPALQWPLSPAACSLSHSMSLSLLPQSFFRQDPVSLAPQLLGKLLKRDDVILRISEVEAYCQGDTACHARFGRTERTAPLFGPGGHAYVYLCYGLHQMLNVTADEEGRGAACLIRACEPVSGLETILSRRGMQAMKPGVLAGPGRVGAALGLTTVWSGHALYDPGGLELIDAPSCQQCCSGPRVGIEYAKETDRLARWRFAIAGSEWVSSPKKTLSLAHTES